MRERDLFVHRTDVHHGATTLQRVAVAHEGLGGEEQALHVRVHHQVVVLFGHVPEIGMALHAGVVDQDVQTAQRLHRALDQLGGRAGGADVGWHVDRAAAQRLDLLDEFARAAIGLAAVEHDVGALAGEAQRDRGADALGAAGDEGGFLGKAWHGGMIGRE